MLRASFQCCLTRCASAAGHHAGARTNLHLLAAPSESAARAESCARAACRLHARLRLVRGAEAELLGLVLQDERDL